MAKSNFEPYDFLCDNGFFDSSFVATPNEVKNEVVLNSKKVPTNINDRFYRRISVYDFLMSRDNVIEFCEFIQETMAAEKKDEQKKNAQNEKCSKIVNDILSEKGKDQ
jgi:hypothetical protein